MPSPLLPPPPSISSVLPDCVLILILTSLSHLYHTSHHLYHIIYVISTSHHILYLIIYVISTSHHIRYLIIHVISTSHVLYSVSHYVISPFSHLYPACAICDLPLTLTKPALRGWCLWPSVCDTFTPTCFLLSHLGLARTVYALRI